MRSAVILILGCWICYAWLVDFVRCQPQNKPGEWLDVLRQDARLQGSMKFKLQSRRGQAVRAAAQAA